mgnify:CR=1 FL=1|jgi:hypothetical protein
MDAVKFIEERNRMCKSFDDGCQMCPACNNDLCCAVGQESTLDATAQIAIVEEWSAAHPRKTRQSVFLEQWPTAKIDKSGCLDVCPYLVSATHRNQNGVCKGAGVKRCSDCRREFWMQEVE